MVIIANLPHQPDQASKDRRGFAGNQSACGGFHRTLKEEFFSVLFRKTFYESLEQLQRDLDQFLNFYNQERAHQGYRTQGRTPYQTFLDRVKETMTEKAA